ncbi:hypothetical protein [Xanthobacter sp. ZOL 2024]
MGDRNNRTWGEVKSDPGLLQVLQRLKDHEMTPEEIDAQRRSWVRGEMMIDHPEMTLEEADAVVRKVAGPPLSEILSTARAEARREALEEAVKIFDKQRPEWVTKKQGEYWDGYRDAIEDAIDEIRGVSTITKHRRAAALSELAAQDAELIEEPDPDLLRDDAHERRRMMKEYPDEE